MKNYIQGSVDHHLYENKTHGTPLFAFETYRMINTSGTLFVTSHWHPEIEMLCFESGTASILLSGKIYEAAAGDIIFVNQGELHQISSDSEDVLYHACLFPLDSLSFSGSDYAQNHYLQPLLSKELFFRHFLSHTQESTLPIFTELLDVIGTYEEKAPGYQLYVKASLLKIISLIIRSHLLTTPSEAGIRIHTEREHQLKKILTYIEEHYENRMYLEDIAEHFHMSAKYFSRYFKNHFGRSFIEYLNHFRIEKSCAMLAATDMHIMEISFAAGFDNFSYFIRKFKEITGFTPSAYRTMITRQID